MNDYAVISNNIGWKAAVSMVIARSMMIYVKRANCVGSTGSID